MNQKTAPLNQPILWHKVIAIASIQGAITLTWIIYNLYFGDLLKQLGLAAELVPIVLIIERFLEVIIEPIAGNFSDQQERKIGTNLPIITLGIIFSSGFFLFIPAVVIFGNESVKWLLIIGAICWAMAMAIFRAPVMGLLRKTAHSKDLVQSASILTLFSSIIGAFQFDVFGILLKLGAPFAFFLGSVVLIGSGFAIQRFFPPEITESESIMEQETSKKFPLINLIIISLTGVFIGLGLRFFYPTITQVFNSNLGEKGKLAMMLFSIILGISALGTGKLALKIGDGKAILGGTIITGIFLLILVFIPLDLIKILSIIILLISFSFVLNGVLPFILSLVPKGKTGFGMGLYFGCFGGAISLSVIFDKYITKITPSIGSIGGFIFFAIASFLIYFSLNQKIINPVDYN
jgi:Na+/melibiose symporter-like transporter